MPAQSPKGAEDHIAGGAPTAASSCMTFGLPDTLRAKYRPLRHRAISVERAYAPCNGSRDPTPELGPYKTEISCCIVAVSAGTEPVRGSSTGVVVVVRNSMGDSHPSAECGRAVL